MSAMFGRILLSLHISIGSFAIAAFVATPLAAQPGTAPSPAAGPIPRVDLNFQDVPTRAVLQLLAEAAGINIVASDSVVGHVTLHLNDVPWTHALDVVLLAQGLMSRRVGEVLWVAPAAEIAAHEQAQLEEQVRTQQLEPLRTEFIQVHYARAAELAELIEGDGGMRGLLSTRGSVAVDTRTNTLLVHDASARLQAVRSLVAMLDVPVRQVLIEARIVVVSDDFSRELGIRLGAASVAGPGAEGLYPVVGAATAGDLGGRYMVNLPAGGASGSFSLSVLGAHTLLELELAALQAQGQAEVISAPRIVTADQQAASIEQGVQIPFQEATANGATTTSFREAALSLTVLPRIAPNDSILLQLTVSNDTVGQVLPNATGGYTPSIDTRRIATQVLIRDGETVVLGGIYETERRQVVSKVPFLGDLPILGYFFRTTQTVARKTELLVFVTPRILRPIADPSGLR